VVIEPAATTFAGPAYVLTAARTTTSAEALVRVLQMSGRAPAIGQPTGGKPLISKPIDVRQGWTLWLAAYDYAPPSTTPSRPGRAVRPDVPARDSLGEARRRLKTENGAAEGS
jgi:C-terminal processing protease CtpA/Prc